MTGPFLARWSRRKLEAKTEAPPPPPPMVVVAEPDSPSVEQPDPPELPTIESLGAQSDYSAFLKPGVSAALRQEALNRLWATDPTLMAPEIMDLHMGDYTQPLITEVVKTAWRFGKGVLDSVELAAEEEEKAKLAAAPPPPAETT
jgi:hypothetical protein